MSSADVGAADFCKPASLYSAGAMYHAAVECAGPWNRTGRSALPGYRSTGGVAQFSGSSGSRKKPNIPGPCAVGAEGRALRSGRPGASPSTSLASRRRPTARTEAKPRLLISAQRGRARKPWVTGLPGQRCPPGTPPAGPGALHMMARAGRLRLLWQHAAANYPAWRGDVGPEAALAYTLRALRRSAAAEAGHHFIIEHQQRAVLGATAFTAAVLP